MQTITNTWQSDGQTVTVTTQRESGETVAEFMERHAEAVEVAKETWPPEE